MASYCGTESSFGVFSSLPNFFFIASMNFTFSAVSMLVRYEAEMKMSGGRLTHVLCRAFIDRQIAVWLLRPAP